MSGGARAWRVGAGLLAALALPLLEGCAAFIDELSDNEYSRDGGGAADGAGTGGEHPGMVHVQAFGLDYWIDATEVTNADYAAWLAESPDPSSVDARCSTNASLRPGVTSEGCVEEDEVCWAIEADFDSWVEARSREPVRCVDFCDAKQFCAAHGKHLCGGPGGASLTYGEEEQDEFVGENSEWYVACSGGVGQHYPYGDDLVETACNDGFLGIDDTVDVGVDTCEGGYAGLFDMSGNVDEWVDACYPGEDFVIGCVRGGGAYDSSGETGVLPSCAHASTLAPHCQSNTTGFRCCSD